MLDDEDQEDVEYCGYKYTHRDWFNVKSSELFRTVEDRICSNFEDYNGMLENKLLQHGENNFNIQAN